MKANELQPAKHDHGGQQAASPRCHNADKPVVEHGRNRPRTLTIRNRMGVVR